MNILRLESLLKTHVVAKVIRYYDELESTNETAKLLIDAGIASHGNIIISEKQTAGKGRLNRKWETVPGKSIACSICLDPIVSTDKLPILGVLLAISIVESISLLGVEGAKIKWPNDVFLQGKKVAGILLETRSFAGIPQFVIIGFGINVLELDADFTPDMKPLATSISLASGKDLKRETLLAEIINNFEPKIYTPETVFLDVEKYLIHKKGDLMTVDIGKKVLCGSYCGIDGRGKLLISLLSNSEIAKIPYNAIAHIRMEGDHGTD